MKVPIEVIKELRERTGAGIKDCKEAFIKACGDVDKAVEILREKGFRIAEKKAQRSAREGLIEAYVHAGGRIGALVEVNCETDFVARTDEFKQLAHDIAMQVVATNPKYLSPEDVPDGEDPEEVCLLLQPFIKDPSRKVKDIIADAVGRLRENIKVKRFVRFELGE